ncbi:hypothetical protein [Kitasatospora sp. MAP5-34]|uniref:hypothetical protein n=1 Tax=Kitasatospora sp. MAP5-34 TaxID=3035102 RepID=UPI0024749AFB|nr:hypothetical protein [Kitasatospora sp. MAP5-34]MDH6580652.1 hypothetical protein [Kitasatospora sp. MAP5-34]
MVVLPTGAVLWKQRRGRRLGRQFLQQDEFGAQADADQETHGDQGAAGLGGGAGYGEGRVGDEVDLEHAPAAEPVAGLRQGEDIEHLSREVGADDQGLVGGGDGPGGRQQGMSRVPRATSKKLKKDPSPMSATTWRCQRLTRRSSRRRAICGSWTEDA